MEGPFSTRLLFLVNDLFYAVMSTTAIKRGEASRARILDTARDILAKEGLDRFVLRGIAKRAGMRLGNLQYYFSTRDDLLEAVIHAEFERNLQSMRTLGEQASSLRDYMQRLSHLLIEEYMSVGGNIWPVLNLLHLHTRRFRRQSSEIYQQHFDIIVAALRKFGVEGKPGALLEKARLITAIIDGAALQAHAGPHSRASRSWQSLRRKTGEMAVAIAEA